MHDNPELAQTVWSCHTSVCHAVSHVTRDNGVRGRKGDIREEGAGGCNTAVIDNAHRESWLIITHSKPTDPLSQSQRLNAQ